LRTALYILGELTDEDTEWLVENGHKETLLTGADIIRQGEEVEALYIVLDGELSLLIDGVPQKGINLRVGDILGEISFVDDRAASATVRASTACQLLAIPHNRIEEKLAQDTGFASRFYHALALFLAYRLRRNAASAYISEPDDNEPLGDAVLDDVYMAGTRLKYLLDRLVVSG
jgi:CRP/FNR family cyclic AMP-dependent transcriptional regulator